MKLNEARWDRGIRVILGVLLLALGWGGIVTGSWGLALKIVGFLPLITGLVGFLYAEREDHPEIFSGTATEGSGH